MPCGLQEMAVAVPPGKVIGYVNQEWSCVFPTYSIRDPENSILLMIDGPLLTCRWVGRVLFTLRDPDDSSDGPSGAIMKHWSGVAQEVYTDADNFEIRFPRDLPVTTKALVLAACLLLDYMHFEH